jgi:protein-S-isoprenylcysteine O-methyltransferase Ste14
VDRPYNRPLAFIRLVAIYAAVGAMLALARPAPLRVWPGAALVLVGEAIRVWAAGHLVKNERLVTSGPYAHVRNPLYLGRLCIFAGLCVMLRLPYEAGWLVLIVGLGVFFGYYLPRKERVEPDRLRELHGEAFESYRREVPALVPRFRAWDGADRQPWSAARALANREHWMVALLTGIVAFALWLGYS